MAKKMAKFMGIYQPVLPQQAGWRLVGLDERGIPQIPSYFKTAEEARLWADSAYGWGTIPQVTLQKRYPGGWGIPSGWGFAETIR